MRIITKNKSFRYRLTLSFMLGIFLILFIMLSGSTVFLQKYYFYRQKAQFVSTYTEVKRLVGSESEDVIRELYSLASNADINMVVCDENFREFYTNSYAMESADINTLKKVLMQIYDVVDIPENSDYAVKNFESQQTGNMLVLVGRITDKHLVFLIKPVLSMLRSVDIYKEFILFLSIIMAFLSSLCAYFISKGVSDPINELVDISDRIANMDFSKKYVPKGESDIDKLGNSLNVMSDKLSENIVQLYRANTILKNDITQKERNEQMRQEFLQNASHELKTPIAVISSYCEMLKDKIITEEEDREYYYDVIYDETQKMSEIVKEMLMLAQFESGNDVLNIENFNITEVVEDVLETYSIIAQKENITIVADVEDKLVVSADMLMIERVMSNYISNAIYHVENDDKVYVTLKSTEDGILFETKNKTTSKLDDKKIWTSFYKDANSKGNGLGLSIVKAIMDFHNKKYGVKCEDGYAIFYFIL